MQLHKLDRRSPLAPFDGLTPELFVVSARISLPADLCGDVAAWAGVAVIMYVPRCPGPGLARGSATYRSVSQPPRRPLGQNKASVRREGRR